MTIFLFLLTTKNVHANVLLSMVFIDSQSDPRLGSYVDATHRFTFLLLKKGHGYKYMGFWTHSLPNFLGHLDGLFDEWMGFYLISYSSSSFFFIPLFKVHFWERKNFGGVFFKVWLVFSFSSIFIYLFSKFLTKIVWFLFFYYPNTSHPMTLTLILPYIGSDKRQDDWWIWSDLVIVGIKKHGLGSVIWSDYWVKDRRRRQRPMFSRP